MKKNLLIIISVLMAGAAIAASQGSYNKNETGVSRAVSVDISDTVVFDLSQAIVSGNTVEFPVYFLSDEIINALDFSFKYNELNFDYDSIFDLTNYMQALSYYNPNDSTVRFTSYSFQDYTNDTSLLSVRFIILSGQLCSVDLNTIHAYLNGDACSFKIINCLPTGIDQVSNDNASIQFYPNPADEIINVVFPEKAVIELSDLSGRKIVLQEKESADETHQLHVQDIPAGVYILRIYNNSIAVNYKIVIRR